MTDHFAELENAGPAKLEQNRECPHGTSATLSRGSIGHTSQTSLDAATAVTVELARGYSHQRPCRCRLRTSPGKPRIAWALLRLADCLQKLQPGGQVRAVVVSVNAGLDPHVVLNVAFLLRPSYLNTTPDPLCIGHTCIYFFLLIVALRYTRIYASCWLPVVFNAEYVSIHRALRQSFSRSCIFQLLKTFGPSFSGPANSAPPTPHSAWEDCVWQ